MKYDFTTKPDRRGNDALAVDYNEEVDGFYPGKPKEGFSTIPMWVADMNFLVAPPVMDAILKRAAHPSFGYFPMRKEYTAAIIKWQRERNGVSVAESNIGYENGVLGCLASAIRTFTSAGGAVFLNTPNYGGFFNTIKMNGRRAVESPLYLDENNIWRMDYADIERKLDSENVHFAILCSPHNPTGRVWEREELERLYELFRSYDVVVFSDEIWSDIILGDKGERKYIPAQSVSGDAAMRTIAAYAPSKTFNLAGLVGSYHIVYNRRLRDLLIAEEDTTHYNSMNVLSQHALIGAYSPEGMVWTDELCEVLTENVRYTYEFISENFDGVRLSRPEGTYMMYLDVCENMKRTGRSLDEILRRGWDVGVIWQDGRSFRFDNSIRLNLALPKKYVVEAMDRLKKYVF